MPGQRPAAAGKRTGSVGKVGLAKGRQEMARGRSTHCSSAAFGILPLGPLGHEVLEAMEVVAEVHRAFCSLGISSLNLSSRLLHFFTAAKKPSPGSHSTGSPGGLVLAWRMVGKAWVLRPRR